MQTIKELTNELNLIYRRHSSKIYFAIILCSLIMPLIYAVAMSVAIFFAMNTSGMLGSLVPLVVMYFLYFLLFVLCYGFFVMVTRLKRGVTSTLGFLFIGFKQKKIYSSCLIFSFMLSLCFIVSATPLLKFIDVTDPGSLEKLLTDTQLLTRLSLMISGIFLVLFVCVFVMFSFTWNVINDSDEVKGFKALAESFKLMKKKLFKFIGFLISANKIFIVILILTNAVSIFMTIFNIKNNFMYLFSFVNLYCLLSLFCKTVLSICFFYDKLKDGGNEIAVA